MAVVRLLVFFALFHPVVLYRAEAESAFYKNCAPFHCGKLGEIQIPFTNKTRPAYCGPFVVDDCNKDTQKIQLVNGTGRWYEVERIFQGNTISITDREFQEHLYSRQCKSFNNLSIPRLSYAFFKIEPSITLLKCDHSVNVPPHFNFSYHCTNFSIYYTNGNISLPSPPPYCSIVQLPVNSIKSYNDIFGLLTASFTLKVGFLPHCYLCHLEGRECQHNGPDEFVCAGAKEADKKLGLILGLGFGCPAIIVIILSLIIFIRCQYRRQYASSNFLSGNNSSDATAKSDREGGNVYFSVPIFSYTELKEATNNFDSERELGDGGFGTVYYGKLQDGQEVAVKRLYGHNYRRVEQFMNEIEILTRLRHENLVSLYGCTSRRSCELILVYEYVPNGTVADHLHGDRANFSLLSWPIRMRIAIETASALAYLHASDIIHRDVKTTNILLDNNFCVKVADFGLSRLFPNDVSHVSTAPQGTPGYVDPEYHQCYQLTDKSDVYSFGVVLIELISSMPAVDITRHRLEINLANLAINKIQKCAVDELIDPCLGYKSDKEVKSMTTLVAELAFRCLQQEKELRPSMDEVLEELERIESPGYKNLEEEHGDDNIISKSTEPPPSPPGCDEAALLKNFHPPSPNSVAHKWISSSSTASNNSG